MIQRHTQRVTKKRNLCRAFSIFLFQALHCSALPCTSKVYPSASKVCQCTVLQILQRMFHAFSCSDMFYKFRSNSSLQSLTCRWGEIWHATMPQQSCSRSSLPLPQVPHPQLRSFERWVQWVQWVQCPTLRIHEDPMRIPWGSHEDPMDISGS